MKRLLKPTTTSRDVFLSCVSGIDSNITKTKVLSAYSAFADAEIRYEMAGKSATLSYLGVNQNLIKGVDAELWRKLYTQYMVPEEKPGRRHYDEILVSANGRCPLCIVGHAASIDHYLPKSKHPIYSVLINNLVPACESCNKLKGNRVADRLELQTFHPYFERDHFYKDQWISATLQDTKPFSVVFFASPPRSWSAVDRSRAEAHFSDFKLARKFGIEAASEISLIDYLIRHQNPPFSRDTLKDHLKLVAESTIKSSDIVNHWKAVLYETLLKDPLFIGRYL
jgi:HNH endonuclease